MKMLKIVVFALVALLLVAVRASPVNVEVIQLEEACAKQGGFCVHSDECKPEFQAFVAGFNLCPKQQRLGVLCCYF